MQRRSRSNWIIFLGVLMAALIALGVTRLNDLSGAVVGASTTAKPATPAVVWLAAAPGRVEPKGGEARIASPAAGRIVEVAVAVNDTVQAGDLLVRLEDEEVLARIVLLEAEVAARRRERDLDPVKGLPLERRQAEDAVAAAERQVQALRLDLDQAQRTAREGRGASDAVAQARRGLQNAREKLEIERQALRRIQGTAGMPLHTRGEALLAAGRAELLIAEIALERTRIRAPIEGTLLQLAARLGETAAPSPEHVLAVIGNLSQLRVRAEFEERDAPKLKVGQRVIVRADAFPGKDFEGTVGTISQALGAPRLAQRGPRRPTDVDILDVLIDLAPTSPRLYPGMRVDVLVKPDASAVQKAEQ